LPSFPARLVLTHVQSGRGTPLARQRRTGTLVTPLNSADPSRPFPGEAATPRPLALFAAITAVNASLLLAGAGAPGRSALRPVRPLVPHRAFRADAALCFVLLAVGAGAHHLYL